MTLSIYNSHLKSRNSELYINEKKNSIKREGMKNGLKQEYRTNKKINV